MAKMIPVSFKDNKLEQDMYVYVKGKYSPSAYIKELITKDMNGIEVGVKNDLNDTKKEKKEVTDKPNNINLSALKSIGR